MNPSTALAAVLIDELIRGGVTEAVVSPGSRNAPLSLALHAADGAGRLRLHVRIDERTAAFLALGIAKASGGPVVVVTTSGTAAVNAHPAVVEADYSGTALMVVTADRPAELRGVGANQTIDQLHLYGGSVRYFADIAADDAPGAAGWRATARAALAAARSGPVHLNIALREPLLPDSDTGRPEPLIAPTADHLPVAESASATTVVRGLKTVVVAGDRAGRAARDLAEVAGWPLLAEPSSGARAGPNSLATYRLLLSRLSVDVERVVVLGRPTLSREIAALLGRSDVDVVRTPMGVAVEVVGEDSNVAWLQRWLAADRAARAAVSEVLDGGALTGPAVARIIGGRLTTSDLMVAGSSSAIRDLDLIDPWADAPLVLANRGASGIDGTVSTAIGAALAHQRSRPSGDGKAYALMGDLTFLHDSTGLIIGPDEPLPDLTLVVVNDNGGGLFTLLEQGAPEHRSSFERVFGTPHGTDLGSLCAASAISHQLVMQRDEVQPALSGGPGIRVVEIRVDRSRRRELEARLRAAVDDACS